jgi:wobble nucleotide-excising tRNase
VKEQLALLESEQEALRATLARNLTLLESKTQELSRSIGLDSLAEVITRIQAIIETANVKTAERNHTVEHIKDEKEVLKRQVWRYIVEQLEPTLRKHDAKTKELAIAARGLGDAISSTEQTRKGLLSEIELLERQTTSVQPTLHAINELLESLGFKGFRLAQVGDANYILVREDGTDATETLSEGERSFVTFLYFYHRLKGSTSGSETTEPRVVIIDDPVSSLDSDILFVVSSLIREMSADAANGSGNVKQVLVLTHNVYFHKEVTYGNALKGGRAFWIVRKPEGHSRIVAYSGKNPIKTSYQLLWEEVFGANRSAISVQNAMRRILEHYFKTLGGTPVNDLPALFTGNDKLVCRSLVSWVHDGSHSSHDDWFVCVDDSCIEMYLRVFRAIFEKTQHTKHYEMMCEAIGVTGGAENASEVCVVAAPVLE